MNNDLQVVTGAFGFSGKYIARELLARGKQVRTLVGRPGRPDPFGGRVEIAPLSFDDPAALVRNLRGATTLYNTYWVRFPRRGLTYERAVSNTEVLFRAAREAGVARIVHVSITNPSIDLPFPYFRGKAQLEAFLASSGMSYAILRPAVIFGPEDILINNMAWLLRRFPLFAIPGNGNYRVQPIYAKDLAQLAADAGARQDNIVLDAVGPEVFTYEELVHLVARAVGSRARLIHLPPWAVWVAAKLLGPLVGDVLLTWHEIGGLMADLLVSHQPPTGQTSLSSWAAEHAGELGRQYASELHRHYVVRSARRSGQDV